MLISGSHRKFIMQSQIHFKWFLPIFCNLEWFRSIQNYSKWFENSKNPEFGSFQIIFSFFRFFLNHQKGCCVVMKQSNKINPNALTSCLNSISPLVNHPQPLLTILNHHLPASTIQFSTKLVPLIVSDSRLATRYRVSFYTLTPIPCPGWSQV